MATKQSTFRIFGPEVGEVDSYIDVEVSGLGEDGNIYFSDTGSDREWSLTSETVQGLRSQGYLLSSDDVVDHALWKLLDSVEKDRTDGVTGTAEGGDALAAAQRKLFDAVVAETVN